MAQSDDSIRAKIVLATITCIEREGRHNVTTRGIAAEAGVNVAAINYYFGSKEKLLDLALEQTLNEGFVNNLNEIMPEATRDTLAAFLDMCIVGMISWPNISRAHLMDEERGDYVARRFNQFLEDLLGRAGQLISGASEQEKRRSLTQMIAAILYTGLMRGQFSDFLHDDLATAEGRGRFVRHLMDRYCTAAPTR